MSPRTMLEQAKSMQLQHTICICIIAGPSLPMATVDIKNPEITTNRFYGSQVNNIPYAKEKKKGKAKKKRLTKADIGTPSNFQ